MEKYGLHGKLSAQVGKGKELAAILSEASSLVSGAKGCRLYMISKDPLDENSVWVTEVWDTKADHDNSLSINGVKELIAKAIPILAGQPEKGLELEVIAGI